MSDINAAVEGATQEAQKVLTDADVGLDAATLAADNIAGSTKLQDAEFAAQKIQMLEMTVKELQQTISDMTPAIAAIRTFMESAPEVLKLKDDLQSAMADFESELPEQWKTRLTALLVHSRQYMGL